MLQAPPGYFRAFPRGSTHCRDAWKIVKWKIQSVFHSKKKFSRTVVVVAARLASLHSEDSRESRYFRASETEQKTERERYATRWRSLYFYLLRSFLAQGAKFIWSERVFDDAPLLPCVTLRLAGEFGGKRYSALTTCYRPRSDKGRVSFGFWVALRCLVNGTSEASSTNLFLPGLFRSALK